MTHTKFDISELQRQAVQEALVGILVGGNFASRPCFLTEADEQISKQQVEQIVRKVLNHDLDDRVVKVLKRELKAQNFEDTVTGVTSKALSKFFEIMFTRKSTWMNQLKGR